MTGFSEKMQLDQKILDRLYCKLNATAVQSNDESFIFRSHFVEGPLMRAIAKMFAKERTILDQGF